MWRPLQTGVRLGRNLSQTCPSFLATNGYHRQPKHPKNSQFCWLKTAKILLCKQEVVGSIPSGSTNIPFRSAICLLGSIAPRRQSVLPGWLQLCISGHCCPHVTAWAHWQFVSSCVSCKPRIHAPGPRDRCHNILSAGTLITGPVSIKVSGPSGSGYV